MSRQICPRVALDLAAIIDTADLGDHIPTQVSLKAVAIAVGVGGADDPLLEIVVKSRLDPGDAPRDELPEPRPHELELAMRLTYAECPALAVARERGF